MTPESEFSQGALLQVLNSSWLAATVDLSRLADFYQSVQEYPIPLLPIHITLWSILFWALCILVIAPRALGVVFSIVIFFVARIPGVRLTVGKISMIDGFQDIKFHYDKYDMSVSISVDAIKLRPWFYAPALVQKPRKFLVGLIERPEIILCIKTSPQDVHSQPKEAQNNSSALNAKHDSKLLKIFTSIIEILVSKLSIKVTRDHQNELLAIDCLKTSILGNFYAHLEAPVQSPRRFLGFRNFRRYMKANSLLCPEITSQNFCCQIQYSEQLVSSRKPLPVPRSVEVKSLSMASDGLPPPAPPPPPVNSLWSMLTFSPWKPPLGVNFEINSGHAKQDVYLMASELNRRNIPAAFSISSFSLFGRGHVIADEKASLKWDLKVSPVCFVCCLDHIQKISFFADSSVPNTPSASRHSTPTSVRRLLENLPPVFPLSCSFEKLVICAAFSVLEGQCSQSSLKTPSGVCLDAMQISFEKTLITGESTLVPAERKSGMPTVQGHASVHLTFESMQSSYMSVEDMALLEIKKFECNTKLALGQASTSAAQRSLAAEAKIARARASGVNGLVLRRARRPSADAGQMAFIVSEAAGADESVTLDSQIMCADLAVRVSKSLLHATAHFSRNILSLLSFLQAKSKSTVSTDPSSQSSLFSHLCVKCQIETVSVALADFSRQKDAITEILWKSWTMRFSEEEPGTFSNRSFTTETSLISVNFSISCTPASMSHCLHGVFLENSNALITLQSFKFSSSSSNGHSIELKSIIILLSEPVVFDVALALKSISGNLHVYKSMLSKVVNVDDSPRLNSPKTPSPIRLDVKHIGVTLFYDSSAYAACISEQHLGTGSEEVWLSLFHFVCSDIDYERTYKVGQSSLYHQFSTATINLCYVSPPMNATQIPKHVSADDCFSKNAQAVQVLDLNRIRVNLTEKNASSLIIASIRAVGAYDGRECASLNLECVTALLSASSTFSRLVETFKFDGTNLLLNQVHSSSDIQNEQLPLTTEIWIAVDFEFMSFTFSATPRSKLQASFACLSARRRTCCEAPSSSLSDLVLQNDDDECISSGSHSQFFDTIFEPNAVKGELTTLLAVVFSEVSLNYLPVVAHERVPFSSFRLGPDFDSCENVLTINTVAITVPSIPASEYNEEKMKAMLQRRVQNSIVEEESLHCPPLDHITLQLINVVFNAFVSQTTTVSGRNILKNKPYGLVDFGMIIDDTLLAIKACRKSLDDGSINRSPSRTDSEGKLALCLFVKQAKLCVKEHRLAFSKDGEALVSGEGWLWALHCLHQDELIEREKRWVEVQKIIKLQKAKKHSGDDKDLRYAFDSENATIWKERVKKLKEKLKQQPDIIPDLCVISIDHVLIGLTSWSQSLLINSMMERLDDSGAKRSVFQSEWPEFDDVLGGLIFGSVSKFRMQLRAFENPLIKFETYEWAGKVVMAEEQSHADILVPYSISLKNGTRYIISVRRSCLPMKLYHQTQAKMSGFCFFYGSAHAQCISMMGAALSSLAPPSPIAITPLLPFDKLRLMLHGTSEIQFIPAVADGPAIEMLLSISKSPQAFGDAVQFLFNGVKLETSLSKFALECRGVDINFLYGEKLIWPFLSSHEMKVIISFDWICLGSPHKHHFNQIMNQVKTDGGSLRSMMGKGDLLPTFRSAGVRLKLELDTVSTVLRLHVDSLTFIFRVLNSLDGVGNSFLQYKSFHTAEGFYFSLPERTKPFGKHILSISMVFRADPVSIFCFYSGSMPSRQPIAPVVRAKSAAGSELHHGVFRFATKTFVFKLEQSHILQPASKYDQRMAIMMQNDDVPRKLEWVINTLEIETKMLSIYDVGFHHDCNGWYGDGNTLVMPSSSSPHSTKSHALPTDTHEAQSEVDEHFNFLEYRCRCFQQCALDGRQCDIHQIIATSVGVKLAARADKADGPRGSSESQRSNPSQRSTSLYEDAFEGILSKKTAGSDVRDRTRQWVGGLAVGEAGVKAVANISSLSPLAVLSELLKKPASLVIKSEDRYFVPSSFSALGPTSPKIRVIDARDMMLDIVAESLFVQITYENRYAYSVWSNGLRCSLKDEPVKRRNQDVHTQLSESEIKWRRFLDPTDEMIGLNVKTSDARGKLAVPENWQFCNEYQGTINRIIWRLQLKEPQLGIQALPPERQGKSFQCRLQHRLLLTGKTGQILNMAVRFSDKKEKCWKAPRSHTSLVMDGIMVRMAADNNFMEHNIATSRRSQRRGTFAANHLKDAPDEETYILTKLWRDVGWVTGDAIRNAAQQIVLEAPRLKFSFFCDLVAPNSVKNSSDSKKENIYMHSPTHVDLSYGNVVSVLIQDVKIVTDCVQFRVFYEVINGLLRPLPTEAEADDMMEALRLNALLDSNEMRRIKKIEMDINNLKRQRNDPSNLRHEEDLCAEQTRLEAQFRQLTQAGQEQLSEQRLRFLSYHLLNCTWEMRATEKEIDSAFEKGVRSGSQGSNDQITTFSKVQLEDVFGTVSYANTEPQGFSFRVRSFVVNNQTSDHPRLGEFVFQPKEGLSPSPLEHLSEVYPSSCILITSQLLILRQIQAHVQNASNIAAAIHKFLGGVDEDSGVLHEIHSDESHMKQQVMRFFSLAISWASHLFLPDAQHRDIQGSPSWSC